MTWQVARMTVGMVRQDDGRTTNGRTEGPFRSCVPPIPNPVFTGREGGVPVAPGTPRIHPAAPDWDRPGQEDWCVPHGFRRVSPPHCPGAWPRRFRLPQARGVFSHPGFAAGTPTLLSRTGGLCLPLRGCARLPRLGDPVAMVPNSKTLSTVGWWLNVEIGQRYGYI